ncbi:MAG: protein kinase domain-containing protein, partial [Planctomycetota bacterium]
MIGQVIAGIRITASLGEGGMGVVVQGVRESDGRRVAVKFIREEESSDSQFTERFEREARILETLDHGNILKLLDWGRLDDGAYYIVMEFVDGCSLGDLLDVRQKVEVHFALEITRATARALESAWKNNVIHRDVKPDNILLDREGGVKLVDFGLAKDTSDNKKFTLTGQVVGTPAFMSPEQGMGEVADHRSDIYSLGVTLFTMLAGRRPFLGDTPLEVVLKKINEEPPDLREPAPDLPEPVYRLVARMIAKDPDDRFKDIGGVADEVENILTSLDSDTSTIGILVHETTETRRLEKATAVVKRPSSVETTPATGVPPEPAEVIAGKYEVVKTLGKGGMGTVYLVRHRTLNQDFALKVLNPFLASNEAFRERFMREAKAATAFVHKHAVQIREFGEDGPVLYMTMDYCSGRTLQDILDETGAVSEQRAASIAHQMLGALKEAHAAGLIHRDLKPSNIMIEEDMGSDNVRILDFGVAQVVSSEGEGEEGERLTRPGAVMGTVQYMSPEQALGQKIDGRSDLYSLAAILYETVTERLPVEGENPQKILYHLATKPPVPISKVVKGVSKRFEQLILRNLAKDAADRCASAEEFLAELEEVSADLKSTVAIRRRGLPAWAQLTLAAFALVIAGGLLVALWNPFAGRDGQAGLSAEEVAAAVEKPSKAYEEALARRDFTAAADRVYEILGLPLDAKSKVRWEEARKAVETEILRAEGIFQEANGYEERGELLKAVPLYKTYLREFPLGPE